MILWFDVEKRKEGKFKTVPSLETLLLYLRGIKHSAYISIVIIIVIIYTKHYLQSV